MKTLSLIQPWSTLIALDEKNWRIKNDLSICSNCEIVDIDTECDLEEMRLVEINIKA